jgi:hypothetical protein
MDDTERATHPDLMSSRQCLTNALRHHLLGRTRVGLCIRCDRVLQPRGRCLHWSRAGGFAGHILSRHEAQTSFTLPRQAVMQPLLDKCLGDKRWDGSTGKVNTLRRLDRVCLSVLSLLR